MKTVAMKAVTGTLVVLVTLVLVNGIAGRPLRTFGGVVKKTYNARSELESGRRKWHLAGTDGLSERIINGLEVLGSGEEFPQVGVLGVSFGENQLRPFCTATLLDERVVITAAHCADELSDVVEFCIGSVDLSQEFGRCSTIANAYLPQEFNLSQLVEGYDLAILELSTAITGVTRMQIAFQRPSDGILTLAPGFGRFSFSEEIDGKMRFANTQYVENTRCRQLRASGAQNDDNLMCSDGNFDLSEGTICSGDSGGPLVVRGSIREEDYMIGVASFVSTFSQDCSPFLENVYMSTFSDAHIAFIEEVVQDMIGGNLLVADVVPRTCVEREQDCLAINTLECLSNSGELSEPCCLGAESTLECLIALEEECGELQTEDDVRGLLFALPDRCPAGLITLPDPSACSVASINACSRGVDLGCAQEPIVSDECCTTVMKVRDCINPLLGLCDSQAFDDNFIALNFIATACDDRFGPELDDPTGNENNGDSDGTGDNNGDGDGTGGDTNGDDDGTGVDPVGEEDGTEGDNNGEEDGTEGDNNGEGDGTGDDTNGDQDGTGSDPIGEEDGTGGDNNDDGDGTGGDNNGDGGDTGDDNNGDGGDTGDDNNGDGEDTGGDNNGEGDGSGDDTNGDEDGTGVDPIGEEDGTGGDNNGDTNGDEDSTGDGSGGSSTPPGTDPACFPGTATVQLGDGTHKLMSNLAVGDRVLVSNGLFSDVFAFSHRDESVTSKFLKIYAGGESIELSPDHYIPSEGFLVAAREIKQGQPIQLGNGTPAFVERVEPVQRKGLYNPHTLDGCIVVNNILASTYTRAVQPTFAKVLLAIPRVFYRMGLGNVLGSLLDRSPPQLILSILPRGSLRAQ